MHCNTGNFICETEIISNYLLNIGAITFIIYMGKKVRLPRNYTTDEGH